MDTIQNTELTVVGTAGCGQCIATERALTARGIHFTKRDADQLTAAETAALRAAVNATGKLQLPVVITPDRAWTGFQPDLIDTLTASKEGR